MVKLVEKTQQKQLILHYKQLWLPLYPALRVTMINNDGQKHIIDAVEDQRMGLEAGHPDLIWRIKLNKHYYFLYHELKKSTGALSKAQKDWWAEFEPTEYVKGAISYGWENHINTVSTWLSQLPVSQTTQS